uniref:Uncharacterized protein n=1 Tax=Octopus bimaculoides TaxID=37653 RepID=A0A0L8I4I6_OCTBM
MGAVKEIHSECVSAYFSHLYAFQKFCFLILRDFFHVCQISFLFRWASFSRFLSFISDIHGGCGRFSLVDFIIVGMISVRFFISLFICSLMSFPSVDCFSISFKIEDCVSIVVMRIDSLDEISIRIYIYE